MPSRLLFPLLAVLLGACSEQGINLISESNPVGDVSLTGRVCDPLTTSWLPGAVVYTHLLSDTGVLYDTYESYTDGNGYWSIDGLAPNKTYMIYVQYGSEVIDLFEVTMTDTDTVLEEPNCSSSSELSVAVITGDYDQMGDVLSQLGILDYDTVNGVTGDELLQFLIEPDNLAVYDAIFFPGGHLEENIIYDLDGDNSTVVAAIHSSLRGYVDGGGMLYASDWSYDVVEALWPDQIEFLGDDLVPDDAQKGEDTTITAQISDGSMAASVGTDAVPLQFEWDGWPVIESTHPDTVVYMTGDVPWREGMDAYTLEDAPLLVGFPSGQGQVVFSTWLQSSNAEGGTLEVIRYLLSDL